MRLSLLFTPLVAGLAFLAGCGSDSKPGDATPQADAPPPAIDGPVLLTIRIDEDLLPLERLEKYEAPLRDALASAGLGIVKKSGSNFNDDWRVQHIVIVTQVDDVAKGVALLQKKLRELKAPANTIIHQNQPYSYSYPVYERL